MKIRMGFVSNSSSTSYVIAVMRDFVPSEKGLKEFIDDTKDYETDKKMSPEIAKECISKIVEAICSGGSWSAYDGDWSMGGESEVEHMGIFIYSFRDQILVSEADGGHGCDFLHNIFADDIVEKTNKIMGKEANDEDS
jgi:hypothetical protein